MDKSLQNKTMKIAENMETGISNVHVTFCNGNGFIAMRY